MTAPGDALLALWAKTDRKDRQPSVFHPAIFHMIDVGHVAAELLGASAPWRIRFAIAQILGNQDPDSLAAWLALVVAFHDIGKISSPFQAQVEDQRERLVKRGFVFPAIPKPWDIRHQHFSAISFREQVVPAAPGLAELEQVIVDTLAGHHGAFPQTVTLKKARQFNRYTETPVMKDLRQEAIKQILNLWPLPTDFRPEPPKNLRAATAALTGFTILCDWLGSDERWFPPEPTRDINDYVDLSQLRARSAVSASGLSIRRAPPVFSGFRSLFPEIQQPRPLQIAIDHLPDVDVVWPGLYIIEAPTGEGKTEAALALARRLAALSGSDEFYVALPTMATSNQMYGRVLRFLRSNIAEITPVKLVHGQAFLVEDDLRVEAYGDADDLESPAAAAPIWFASRKRALLASFGVGTVDQAELAVLNARHYMLRLFGLAGKVVIIDEVHAYDTYVSTVIDHMLWWLALLGSPVILLSATLPTNRHRQLADAYQRGITSAPIVAPQINQQPALPYPALALYTANRKEIQSPPASQPHRRLTVRFTTDLPAAEEAARLLDLVEGGGAVCRLVNTVRRAQDIFRALRAISSSGVELHLLHARIPSEERLSRESVIADRLGKSTSRRVYDKIIVVGTQVLEQSLDYDVDRMISDLAPVDLLLQRAGRMHRHNRPNRGRFTEPVLDVVVGPEASGLPNLGTSTHVYEPFILWKSWLTLQSRRDVSGDIFLSLPADYRSLIERTYDDRTDVLPVEHPGFSRLRDAFARWERNRSQLRERAQQRLVPNPGPLMSITEGAFIRFEEDEDGGKQGWGFAKTREGEESISIIPLYRVDGGVAVHPHETPLPTTEIGRDDQLRLLRRAIRVSNRDLVCTLPNVRHPELPWWKDAALLRNNYPLVLKDGFRDFDTITVELDPELGLVY